MAFQSRSALTSHGFRPVRSTTTWSRKHKNARRHRICSEHHRRSSWHPLDSRASPCPSYALPGHGGQSSNDEIGSFVPPTLGTFVALTAGLEKVSNVTCPTLNQIHNSVEWDRSLAAFGFVPPGQVTSWSGNRNFRGREILRFTSARPVRSRFKAC